MNSVDIRKEISNIVPASAYRYREVSVPLDALFPRFDPSAFGESIVRSDIKQAIGDSGSPHELIGSVTEYLAKKNGKGYQQILEAFGFWDEDFGSDLVNHCHFRTPALGLVLASLNETMLRSEKDTGISDVFYHECLRVSSAVERTGAIIPIDPNGRDADPVERQRFGSLGRIPFCVLEVTINDRPYFMSPKHVGENGQALLVPWSYKLAEEGEFFVHQDDSTKSDIYLKHVFPADAVADAPARTRFTWRKETPNKSAEFFSSYLRMKLE